MKYILTDENKLIIYPGNIPDEAIEQLLWRWIGEVKSKGKISFSGKANLINDYMLKDEIIINKILSPET